MVVRTQPDIVIVDRYLPYDDADQTITLPAGRSIAFHDFFRYSFEKAFFERALAGYEEKSLDLCRGLRQQMPSLKLVLLTPYPFNAEKIRPLFADGILTSFIVKPPSAGEVIEVLLEVVNRP